MADEIRNYENMSTEEIIAEIERDRLEQDKQLQEEIQRLKYEINHGNDTAENYFNLYHSYKILSHGDKKYQELIDRYAQLTIEVAEREIANNTHTATTLIYLGSVYADKKNNEMAIKYYNAAIDKAPDLADAYFVRGEFYRKRGKKSLAKQDYDKAIELDPRMAEGIELMISSDKHIKEADNLRHTIYIVGFAVIAYAIYMVYDIVRDLINAFS